jgi:hypothetical protein
MPFDFCVKELNVLIEYDGEGHFKPIQFGGISLNRAKEQHKIN